jgi:hypothetical protein
LESSADEAKHLLEIKPLSGREAMEDKEEVTITVESTRLDVQETHQVLQLNETLTLKVDLLRRKSLRN